MNSTPSHITECEDAIDNLPLQAQTPLHLIGSACEIVEDPVDGGRLSGRGSSGKWVGKRRSEHDITGVRRARRECLKVRTGLHTAMKNSKAAANRRFVIFDGIPSEAEPGVPVFSVRRRFEHVRHLLES